MGRERHTAAVALSALLGAAAGGCFFTDDINGPPVAEIFRINEAETLHLGGVIELSAFKSNDPDGDPLTYEWSARECTSITACSPEFQSKTSADPAFDVNLQSKRMVAVSLIVRDENGAEADDSEFYVVLNRAPTVRLQVQGIASPTGGFTVGRPLELVAEASDEDGDELGYEWSLFPVSGSVPANVEWSEVDETLHHLRPDLPGLWRVSVSVDDGDGGTEEAEQPILIDPDNPPCIATTDPRVVAGAEYIVERAAGVRRLAVLSVVDELDPYPLPANDNDPDRGEASFRWQVATPQTGGAFVALDGHALSDYRVDPSGYAPGDVISVRVEVDDRLDRTLPCSDALPTCSIDDNGCLQRVTWGVQIR